MGDWGVTVAEVFSETAETVSDQIVAMASAIVEVHLNCTPGASAVLMPRDLHWIRTSIKWQAAWLPGQPDFATRLRSISQSQDGASVNLVSPSDVTLGPMASRALKNVSWKGWRTISLLDSRYRLGKRAGLIPFANEGSDDQHSWGAI